MKKLTLSILFASAITTFVSCKKSDSTVNAPYITGVAYTDQLGSPIGTLGQPNVKDSIVHTGGTNKFFIYPNPCNTLLSSVYQIFEPAIVRSTLVAAYFPDQSGTKNDSLFGKGPLISYTDTVTFANGFVRQGYYTADLPNGFYRLCLIISTSSYTDSLYENVWVYHY